MQGIYPSSTLAPSRTWKSPVSRARVLPRHSITDLFRQITARLADLTFAMRPLARFGTAEWLLLLAYAALVLHSALVHVSWFDEAQAWLIASSSSLGELLLIRLHYEGCPALWHLMLWALSHMGASAVAMHILAACAAVAGMAVWLRYSRLPFLPAALMPFTFFFLYQYAVIARCYSLAPLLIFAAMALYANRQSSPVAFALCAGLCANASVHMAAFAVGLACAYLVDRLRSNEDRRASYARLVVAATLFCGLVLLAALVAWPTADGSSTASNPLVSALRHAQPDAHDGQQALAVASRPESVPGQKDVASPLDVRHSQKLMRHLWVFANSSTASISTSNGIALIFGAVVLLLLVTVHRVELILPWIFVQVVNVLVTGEAHHLGLLWIALVCAIWGAACAPERHGFPVTLWRVLLLLLLALQVSQIGWSLHALRMEARVPYSSSKVMADYIRQLPSETSMAAFDDDSVTVNLYLRALPYRNQNLRYWPFSRTLNPDLRMAETLAARPDLVSVKMSTPIAPAMRQWSAEQDDRTVYSSDELLQALSARGYREKYRFCGERFFRDSAEARDCRAIYAAPWYK